MHTLVVAWQASPVVLQRTPPALFFHQYFCFNKKNRVGEAGRRWTAVTAASNRKPHQPEGQWGRGHETAIDWQCQPSGHPANRQGHSGRATVAGSPALVCPGPALHNRVCTAGDGELAPARAPKHASPPASPGPGLTNTTTHVHAMRGCPNTRKWPACQARVGPGVNSGRAAWIRPGGGRRPHDGAARYKSNVLKSHWDQEFSRNGPKVWEPEPAGAGRHEKSAIRDREGEGSSGIPDRGCSRSRGAGGAGKCGVLRRGVRSWMFLQASQAGLITIPCFEELTVDGSTGKRTGSSPYL